MGNRESFNQLPGIGGVVSIPQQLNRPEMGGVFFGNLVTKRQLADQLSLSPSFINKLMGEEGLPHLKIGRAVRFRTVEVVAWLQQRRRP